ncbi:Regulator of G-protein signaling loco [Lucilia cuprina]|nr:Regulator of G-protein signaling loco [Lucilia cuprina]
MLHPHSFVQSIAHINDSGTFESSFEVKYIQSTPQRQKNRSRLNDCEREHLRRFVREFEELQACNSSAKSTPKKFKRLFLQHDHLVNIGNTESSRSVGQTTICSRDNIQQYFLPPTPSISPSSSRSSSPVLEHLDMGCKPLVCCDDEEDPSNHDDIQPLTTDEDIANCSVESSSNFDLHPPILPSFKMTPPPVAAAASAKQQQQRNAAYELARFLRGSFHVKRAKITNLRRSLSDNENLQNTDLPPTQMRTSKPSRSVTSTESKPKKKVLEDTTNNPRTRIGSTSSICTRLFPGNTSPFRRVWEQSSLRTPRSDKYALSGAKQKSPGLRCSASMITTESNVFSHTSSDPKLCSHIKTSPSANQKMPMRTQSEKLINSQSNGVKSWANSFEHLLQEPAALATFAEFLKLEFSAENIYFWTSCERYRNTESLSERQAQAKQIFQKYLANGCREPVNLDSQTRNLSEDMLKNAESNLFVAAQKQIFHLMKFDSYQRFIRSDLYKNCVLAEEKDQPLPYGAENLDALLKTNFLQSASPKLKKSASNAEDRRRKLILPWHRKTRSKSRDRVDLLNEEHSLANNDNNSSDGSSNGLNTLLVPSSKLTQLSSTLPPPQTKPPAENSDSQIQNLRSSLPTSLKAVEIGCSLCRVKFCDGATTIVQIKPNETIQQLVERVLEKRGLRYKLYEVVIKGHNKAMDLQASTQELAGEEVEIEQRVAFKLYLPDPKVISVKSKPKKYLHEVVRPILQKYNYDLEAVDVLRRDNQEKIDLSQLVTTADGLRLQIVLVKKTVETKSSTLDYQNDNISMKWLKSKELANEIVARNAMGNSFRNNLRSSQNNLDAITNSIFNDIIQDKANPESKLQTTDQYSIKSDECGSEASSMFGTLNSKKDGQVMSMLRLKNKPYASNNQQHSMEANVSSNSSQTSNEFNKPIIAKLKAGVKLQVTERVAEKQDELLLSLKTRLDNHISVENNNDNNNESDQISAVNLRRIRANLSPVNKTNPLNERPLSLERPQPLTRHSLGNKLPSNRHSTESIKTHNESDCTTINAANKGPPPLPPKPKVLPTKPSNWGFNISDQTTLQ